MRLLRPLLTIRLCCTASDRVGNMYGVLWYLSEKQNGFHQRNFDIFFFSPHTSLVANNYWDKIIREKLVFFPYRQLAWAVYKINRLIPGAGRHVIKYPHPPEQSTLECFFTKDKRLFEFTQEEERGGNALLRELRIGDKPFICFHNRDSAYLARTQPGRDWSYHNHRDTGITNYVKAAEMYLRKNDVYALRMGAVAKDPVSSNENRIIDYSYSGKRTDFLDVYLSAKCRFFLGTDSGINIFSEMFMRPNVYVNWVALSHVPVYCACGVLIFKKCYLIQEKRLLSFKEMFELRKTKSAPNIPGIEFIENTAEEIYDAMMELEERLSGSWSSSPEDEDLQNRFWGMYGKTRGASSLRIGKKFLRENKILLL